MAESNFSIVAGWNNAANLANVEDLSPAGATQRAALGKHYFVHFDNIDRNLTPNGRGVPVSGEGYNVVSWKQELMDAQAYDHLQTTYEGTVTVRTPQYRTGTFLDYNAIFSLDPVSPAQQVLVGNRQVSYRDVTWVFKLVEQV